MAQKQRSLFRKIIRWLLIISFGLMSGCSILIWMRVTGSLPFYSEKMQSSNAAGRFTEYHPELFHPQIQTDGHTCGYHAVSTIYKTYGLAPQLLKIRFRLGVDQKANPLDSTTLGTIHPDLVRVLTQDGFLCTFIDLSNVTTAVQKVEQIVSDKQTALCLIKRPETGNLHWTALASNELGEPVIADSLVEGRFIPDLTDYVNKNCVSIIRLDRTKDIPDANQITLNKRSTLEVIALTKRLKAMKR